MGVANKPKSEDRGNLQTIFVLKSIPEFLITRFSWNPSFNEKWGEISGAAGSYGKHR